MSTTFPLAMCCQLLGVDPKTLRHWLAEAGIEPTAPSTDSRLKLLTLEQLYQVALLYRRPITPPTSPSREEPQAATTREAYQASASLSEEAIQLRQKLAQLEDRLTQLTLLLPPPQQQRGTLPPWHPSLGETPSDAPLASERTALQQDQQPGWCPHPAELRPRMHVLPVIEYQGQDRYVMRSPQEGELSLVPDSPEWFDWLASLTSFRFVGKHGRLSAYRLYKSGNRTHSWRASCSAHDRRYRLYLGITPRLTLSHLEQAAAALQSRVASL